MCIEVRQAVFVLVLVMACAIACSSGGGPPAGIRADFIPDVSNPGSDTVSLGRGARTGDMVTVEVNLTEVQGVYGVAFDLVYDADLATYLGRDSGGILEQGGNLVEYQVSEPVAGRLVVVVTRTGNVSAVDVSGTQTLISFTFRITRRRSAPVGFDAEALLDGRVPPQSLSGINWRAGTLAGS